MLYCAESLFSTVVPIERAEVVNPFAVAATFETTFSTNTSASLVTVFTMFEPTLLATSPTLDISEDTPPMPAVRILAAIDTPPKTCAAVFNACGGLIAHYINCSLQCHCCCANGNNSPECRVKNSCNSSYRDAQPTKDLTKNFTFFCAFSSAFCCSSSCFLNSSVLLSSALFCPSV